MINWYTLLFGKAEGIISLEMPGLRCVGTLKTDLETRSAEKN
jgi:hypothetical protein